MHMTINRQHLLCSDEGSSIAIFVQLFLNSWPQWKKAQRDEANKFLSLWIFPLPNRPMDLSTKS